MAARKPIRGAKRTTRKAAATKPQARKKAPAKTTTRKKAPARAKAPTVEAIARKIVKATQQPGKVAIEDLYTEDCTSWEPTAPEPAVGHAGRREKDAGWEQFQDSAKAKWTARNTLIKRNTICIEWDAEIHPRDGRKVLFQEVAFYEVKGGKIASERFYYNPVALGPPAEQAAPDPPAPLPPYEESTAPQPDPIDL